jgi:hypothetical protein
MFSFNGISRRVSIISRSSRITNHMKSVVAHVLLFLTMVLPVSAQSLRLVSAAPEDGAAGVPQSTTIIFEFDRTLGANTSDWDVAKVEPRSEVLVRQVQLCVNADPCGGGTSPRFVRYIVEHRTQGDFTWMIPAARGERGEVLEEPVVLSYSTAPDIGRASLGGTVSASAAAKRALSTQGASLRKLYDALLDSGLLTDPAHENGRLPAASTASPDQPFTRVMALEQYDGADAAWSFRRVALLRQASGEFEIQHVRSGTYWPVAVRFSDATASEIIAMGFLDRNGDGVPDSVTVGESDVLNLDIELLPFELRTAREGLAVAQYAAADVASDQALIRITGGHGARPSGTAYEWQYVFYSKYEELLTTVSLDPFETTVSTSPAPAYARRMRPLLSSFIDSDEAADAALQDGGDDFLAPYRASNLESRLEAGNMYWKDVPDTSASFWHVEFTATTTSGTNRFTRFISTDTGEIITHSEQPSVLPAGLVVEPGYPNPFSESTTIAFEMRHPQRVAVEVYDLLGRRIATPLAWTALGAGPHRVVWDPAGAGSGVYIISIRTESGRADQQVVLAN